VMTSEDVIHSFYVPAFRVKQDVLPGRYTTMWFEPTKIGSFHLFCAEYCGTKHSGMIGRVVVMEPADYQAWLGGGRGGSLSQAGEKRFNDLGCTTCHRDAGTSLDGAPAPSGGRGPELRGLFGSRVKLRSGETLVADESYLRESILDPKAKVVQGFEPIMPTYATQLDEEGVLELVAYLKSLEAPRGTERRATPPSATAGDDGGTPARGADGGASP
jgi:cytochrome c oxidase subunit II